MTRTLAALALLILPNVLFAADPVSGRWVGQWTSDGGHRGPLRANLTTTPTGYTATFAGRFAGVVPFVYRTPLHAIGASGDAVFLTAERRLPLFGTFRTDAVVTPMTFDATFRSGRDSGRFTLTR
jgi:hypothetical protein